MTRTGCKTDLNITSEQPAAPPVPEVNVETSEKEESPKAVAESEAKGFSGIFTEGNLAPGNDEMAAAVSVSELDKEVDKEDQV